MKRRGGFFIFALFILLAMAGCGGDEGTSPPAAGHPGDGGGSQGKIAPTGGSITVPISGGAEADLVFPDGALRETVSFTITPEQPETGGRVRLRIEPGDIVLAKPVTVRLRLPSGEVTNALAVYVGSLGNRLVLPTAVDAATGTVTAQTHLFAPEAAVSATKPMMASVGEASAAEGGSGFINVAEMNCSNLLPELSAEIAQAKLFEFTSERAYQLTQKYKATKAMCDSLGNATEQAELQQQTTDIQQKACDAQVANVEGINLFVVETEEQLYDKITRLLGSQASLDLVSGPCSPPLTMSDGLTKAVSDYLVEYQKRIDSPNFGGGTWLGLRGEVKSIVKLYDDAGMLLLEDQQQTVIDTLLKPALDKLHARAYQLCRQDNLAEGDQSYLADVMSGGQVFGIPIAFLAVDSYGKTLLPAGLAQDIQYCASDLTVHAYDGTELLPDQTLELGGGDMPGTYVTQGTIDVPVAEGVVSLEGIIRPLRCATPTTVAAYDVSTLVIKFNNVTVQTLTYSDGDFLPNNPVDLDVSNLYTAAGINPNVPGTYLLEIYREGTGCSGVYGAAAVKLFAVTVTASDVPTLAVRLIERRHRATLTFDIYAADASNLYHQTFQTQYMGAPDSFQSYTDTSDPPLHLETVGDTTARVDGSIQQSFSLASGGNGHIVSITGSGSFSALASLTDGGDLCCVNSEGNFGNTENFVEFVVEGDPVAYAMTGTFAATSNHYFAASGTISIAGSADDGSDIEAVSKAVCSGDTSANPNICDGDEGPIPPTVNLNSNGILPPGTYFLMVRLNGLVGVERTEVAGTQTTKEASGNFNFTLTFSPAP